MEQEDDFYNDILIYEKINYYYFSNFETGKILVKVHVKNFDGSWLGY